MDDNTLRTATASAVEIVRRIGTSEPMVAVLAEAAGRWLEDHQPDADEPITEDWLRAVGFKVQAGFRGTVHQIECLRTYPIDYHPGRRWIVLELDDVGDRIPDKLCPLTRGAVRTVCRALGVELKGPAGVSLPVDDHRRRQ